LARAYIAETGVAAATLSRRTVGNTKLFVRLLDGMDCTARSAEAASLWLDLNWPVDAAWPEAVRPRGTALAAAPLADWPLIPATGPPPPPKRRGRQLSLVE
jgi:hypothetical protein